MFSDFWSCLFDARLSDHFVLVKNLELLFVIVLHLVLLVVDLFNFIVIGRWSVELVGNYFVVACIVLRTVPNR